MASGTTDRETAVKSHTNEVSNCLEPEVGSLTSSIAEQGFVFVESTKFKTSGGHVVSANELPFRKNVHGSRHSMMILPTASTSS